MNVVTRIPREAGRAAIRARGLSRSESRAGFWCLWRSRETPVEAPVGSFVHGPYARPRMARPECDEHPDEFALLVTRELHDHAEGSLRCGCLSERQVDLCAARKTRAIGTVGLTGAGIGKCQPLKLKAFAGASGDLKRAPGEPSYRLVPDTLIEPDRQATTAGDTRHGSAFAVGRTQLAHERREVLATGGRRAEP